MNYVIFSIDDAHDMRSIAKFTHFLDVQKAMGRLKGDPKMCIGAYKGVLETSFLVTESDFYYHIEGGEFLVGQESVLLVEDGHHGEMYASLHYLEQGARDGEHYSLGLLKSVDKSVALEQDAWTYRPDLNIYWIAQ